MKPFGRTLAAALLLATLSMTALPAYARWGYTPVDTWVRSGDRVVGREDGTGPLVVWAPVGASRRVIWSIENLGGGIPKLHDVTFHGCDEPKGFRFRYVTPAGTDVTWSVTHEGYVAQGVDAGEKAWLNVWISSSAADRSGTCALEGEGMVGTDIVTVSVRS